MKNLIKKVTTGGFILVGLSSNTFAGPTKRKSEVLRCDHSNFKEYIYDKEQIKRLIKETGRGVSTRMGVSQKGVSQKGVSLRGVSQRGVSLQCESQRGVSLRGESQRSGSLQCVSQRGGSLQCEALWGRISPMRISKGRIS